MEFERYSQTEEAILEALATYRLLTPKQMLRVGVTKASSHLYEVLRALEIRRPAVLKKLDFGALPKYGRLDTMFVLTQAGAEVLRERRENGLEAKAPRQIRMFRNDYFHRKECVEFHITVMQWAAHARQTVDFYDNYYDPVSGNPARGRYRPKTNIPLDKGSFEADAVFALTDHKGTKRLFVFEYYNAQRTARVHSKLETYLRAIKEGAIQRAYRYERNPRILFVFENDDGLRLTQQRARTQPEFGRQQAGPYFFLATKDEVRTRFYDCWQRFDGERVVLFPFS